MIAKLFPAFLMFFLASCFPVSTDMKIGQELNWANSKSMPIYLSFSKSKGIPYYFILEKHSEQDYYKLYVRWKTNIPGRVLFNGLDSVMKFMVNEYDIFKITPVSLPKKISFTLDKLHTEEAEFRLTSEQFRKLSYAKNVKVLLSGRRVEVTGRFNRKDTFNAFRDFDERSY